MKTTKKVLSALLAVLTVFALTLSASAATNTLPGEGYIGLDAGTDPETQINITLPTGNFKWAYTDLTAPNIQAATYNIKNNSAQVDLKVTLVSFLQTNAVTIPGTLVLNLTDDLAKTGVIGTNGGTTPYSALLTKNTTWNFSFSGTYSGSIPATALQPNYDMVLKFQVA